MARSYFVVGFGGCPGNGEKRVTQGEDFAVAGGCKETHELMVQITEGVAKEVKKDPPQTQGEANMIVRDVIKKVRG